MNFKNLFGNAEQEKSSLRQWIEALIIVLPLAFVLRTYVFGLYYSPSGSAEPNILVGDRIFGNKFVYLFNDVQRDEYVIFDDPEFVYDESNTLMHLWQKYIGLQFLFLKAGPANWVKRAIGIPGDVIEGRIEDGKTVIYRNRQKLQEPYLNPYPLITCMRTSGFFNLNFDLGLFNFLNKKTKLCNLTYDPDKKLPEQPFYNINEKDIYVNPMTFSPIFHKPHTPTFNQFGQNVDAFGPITIPEGKYWLMGDNRKDSRASLYWGFLDKSLVHGRASFVIYSIDSQEEFWFLELLKRPIKLFTELFRWDRFGKSLHIKAVEKK